MNKRSLILKLRDIQEKVDFVLLFSDLDKVDKNVLQNIIKKVDEMVEQLTKEGIHD